MLERAITLGEAHEARVLQDFISEFGIWDGGSSGVAQIARPKRHSPQQLRVRQEETVAALESGADVVFQATFFDERFVGFADFLVREAGNSYTVFDTKLARQARVPALLQLAAYADQLERLGFDPGSEVALILGTMVESRHLVRSEERRVGKGGGGRGRRAGGTERGAEGGSARRGERG